MVANLAITSGDSAGELDLQWDPIPGAKTYEIQTSPDPMTSTSWTSQPSVTKSKTVILGLTSGARVWARVRAVNAAGQGAWSDPATKIVP
jgi:outer membrane protein assembly factor BamB